LFIHIAAQLVWKRPVSLWTYKCSYFASVTSWHGHTAAIARYCWW